MKNYISQRDIVEYTLRMAKNYSSFFYFTLESNEGICFYSTLQESLGKDYRDIIVRCTPELEADFQNILQHCQKSADIEVLKYEKVKDSL